MTATTGLRWTRGEQIHPMWCDIVRCLSPYAGTQGEHRSRPIIRRIPEVGTVVATITQLPGRETRLEVTASAPVFATPGRGERSWAENLAQDLADTVHRAVLRARADTPPRALPAR